MKVYTLKIEGLGTAYTVKQPEDLLPELENMEIGEVYTISCADMSEEVFESLPDFEGF